MGKSSNTFKKAIRHLKSTQIDEKLQLLNEIPVNATSTIYIVEPEYQVQDPDVPGAEPADFTQDALPNGRDTTGLFSEDGTILTIEPPDELGNKSFILGPMASMWYAWGNFTTIGYIRQSDRRMVDLGRITGPLGSWNGTNNFTSYGQLTIEQARWFRDTPKLNGANNNTPNYRAYYPGPPSNAPDQYGRYLCVITGTPKPTSYTPPPRRVPPGMGGFDPNLPPGSANPNVAIDNMGGWLAAAAALGFVFKSISDFIDWFNKQSPETKQKLKDLTKPQEVSQYTDDPSTWPSIKNPTKVPPPIIDPKTGWPSVPNVPPSYRGKPGGSPVKLAHYEPQGQVLSENTKRILKDVKKPYVLPEQPKVKYKIKPRASRTINVDLMKKAEVPSSFKKAEDRLWGKYEIAQNSRASQERKNEVLDHLGGSDHFWEFMTETGRQKNNDIMYTNFDGKEKKAKVVRKEELKGDTLLFLADENGNKESILQSELSIRLADEFNKELFEKYFQKKENTQIENDPLFKKVSKRLKKEIDYPDKPAKKGYPNDPPPEMINGWHPKFGERSDYYNKLDPQTASAMPDTDSPQINAKIKAARKKPK